MARYDSFLTKREEQSRKKLQDNGRIYIAEVMDTRSPSRSGEIKVWVLNSNTDKKDPDTWVVAKCASNSFGTTINRNIQNTNNFKEQPTSYGWWNPIPYVGSYVFIFFPCIIGENTEAYWFGSPMTQDNCMLPGIAYDLKQQAGNIDYSAKCEVNYKSPEIKSAGDYTILNEALKRQGLDKDLLRGISTASSFRETPSMCYGFLSPLGNQFVIDDGWSNGDKNLSWLNDPRNSNIDNYDKDDYGEYHSKQDWTSSLNKNSKEDKLNRFHGGFRFRTRNGTQLLILDSGNIYMINKDGSAWMELSDDGYIDCYSAKGVNVASDGDINLHSQRNVNIEAGGMISLKSDDGISIESGGSVNMKVGSLNVSSQISTTDLISTSAKIGTVMSKNAQLTGVFQGTLSGVAQYATSSGVIPVQQPSPIIEDAKPSKVIVTPENDIEQIVGGENAKTIVTRKPTHEPYAGHDKNMFIPELLYKKTFKEEEKRQTSTNVKPNVVRTNNMLSNENKQPLTQNSNLNINISEHFTLNDVCASSTARANGINNTPSQMIIEKLKVLAENVLEPIYKNFGTVIINSGYRGPELNLAVGGSSTSQHCLGEAVDIEVPGINNYDLAVWIKNNIKYDQLILEFANNLKNDPNSGWVHVSYSNKNRRQLLTINSYGTKQGLFA